ncbi:FtsX-like permease family protein [Spirillospora sp. NPDC048911]|uniref:FtsX-like permease family protein n=1 Tax=Spirillospora sp. NPDC048911 TaxID=3364527 RepID=UPI003723B68E
MAGLAFRTLRFRAGGFAAAFLSMFLGASILMTFGSMYDTALLGGASGTGRETMVTVASVVGGWGLLLVVFAVASTLTLSVRQRAEEIALLKSVGATPAQLRRMIVGEAAMLAVAAVALAVVPGALAGRGLLELLISTGQVDGDVSYVFGPLAVPMGLAITFVASVGAALIAVRRAARVRVTEALADAALDQGRMSKKRVAGAALFLLLGLDLAVVTATAMRGEGSDAMSTAGQADICVAIGLALIGPVILRRVVALLAGPVERLGGVTGHLAVCNLRQRTGQLAGALTPIVLFTAIATGTLYMQSTENAALEAAGLAKSVEQKNIETLNLVVIGMIVVFAAIMLVNTLLAATTYRGREFGQQRLAGSTRRQVLGMVALEGAVLTVTGVLLGTVASLFTILPYASVRLGSALPEGGPAVYTGVIVLSVLLTLGTALGAARRVTRTPAVAAVGV